MITYRVEGQEKGEEPRVLEQGLTRDQALDIAEEFADRMGLSWVDDGIWGNGISRVAVLKDPVDTAGRLEREFTALEATFRDAMNPYQNMTDRQAMAGILVAQAGRVGELVNDICGDPHQDPYDIGDACWTAVSAWSKAARAIDATRGRRTRQS